MSARANRYRPRRARVVRELAPPRTALRDDLCSGCTGGWPPLWRLRTPRGRVLRGEWCNGCVMEREAEV